MTELFKSPLVYEKEQWEQLKLTPRQAHDWDNTKTGLLYSYGAFGGILYKMMGHSDNKEHAFFTDKIPTAATDDKVLYINPKTYFNYTLKQQLFIACHEIWHAMFNHCGIFHRYRTLGKITYPSGLILPYVEKVMQCAADCIINDGLVHCHVGEKPEGCYHKPWLITYDMNLLEAYQKLYLQTNGGQGLPQNSPDQVRGPNTNNSNPRDNTRGLETDQDGQAPFDQHLRPGQGRGKTANEAINERSKTEWDAAVTAAQHTMKTMGKGSAGLERIFNKVTEPEYDWFSALRHITTKTIGMGRQTWEYLDPEFIIRGIGAPGRLNYGAGFVIIAIDSSGSIDQPMLDTFMSHVGTIVDDVRPRELLVTQCDDRIHEWEYVQDGTQLKRKVKGGGGTDFRPVFDRIQKEDLRPDALIYFTDMEGNFPNYTPNYPVIWASIKPNKAALFGDVIYVPLQKQRR